MTVKQLIHELLECNMEAEVEFKVDRLCEDDEQSIERVTEKQLGYRSFVTLS